MTLLPRQFIITHNRNTVQAADVIYGVTMGRDSASQVISLKLDEVTDELIGRKIVLVTGAVILVLYLFVIFGVLRGRQEIRFTLDAKGVREQTAGPLKYMNIVKLLLVLSGKPTYASIGLMAQRPKSERITWKRVGKVMPDPQAKTVTLRKGRTDLMILHCTEENYAQVLAWIQKCVRE